MRSLNLLIAFFLVASLALFVTAAALGLTYPWDSYGIENIAYVCLGICSMLTAIRMCIK